MKKKLCTYPRTDSCHLTSDMAEGPPVLVNLVANAMPFRKGIAIFCDAAAVINDKKVTDHHAVIPTRTSARRICPLCRWVNGPFWSWWRWRLLCAALPHIFDETAVTVDCAGAGVYRQGPHGEAARLAGAGRRLPGQHEKCGAGQRDRGQGPAGTNRGPGAAGRRCRRQGGQDHPAQALH